MAVSISRVNTYSPAPQEFTFLFSSWISNTIDTINEAFNLIEARLNQLSAPQFTTVQITALAVDAPNGTFWYDTTTDQLKAKVNGVVVVLA